MEGLVVVAIIAGLGFWLFRMTGGTRARVEIRVDNGRTWVTRGRIPGKVLREIAEICEGHPKASGTVRIEGSQSEPEVIVEGLPRTVTQQVRNVVSNGIR